jgi:hypothetical protein
MKRGKEFIDADALDHYRVCLERDGNSRTGKCGFVHTSAVYFERHLREEHNILPSMPLDQRLKRYTLSREPGTGWCGFCLKMVRWAEYSDMKGDERNAQNGYGKHYDRAEHIDMHVTKEGRRMENYVNLESHLKQEDAKSADKLQIWYQVQQAGDIDSKSKGSRKRKLKAEANSSDEDDCSKKLSGAKWACVSA